MQAFCHAATSGKVSDRSSPGATSSGGGDYGKGRFAKDGIIADELMGADCGLQKVRMSKSGGDAADAARLHLDAERGALNPDARCVTCVGRDG